MNSISFDFSIQIALIIDRIQQITVQPSNFVQFAFTNCIYSQTEFNAFQTIARAICI